MRQPDTYANKESGFIALITAILLAVILLVLVVTLNRTGFIARSEILDSEYKNRSFSLAEACVDSALLKLVTDPGYSGGENIPVDGPNVCRVETVSFPGSQITINTSAIFPSTVPAGLAAITKLQVVVNASDLSVVSWNELP